MITRYVNTASTPGGDGTTNATSGANRAFASLSEAEAMNLNLVTLDDTCEIICTGATADTTAVDFAGWTTSATRFVTVKPAAGDEAVIGSISTSKYRLALAPGGGIDLTIQTNHIRFERLQMQFSKNTFTAAKICVQIATIAAGSSIRFNRCSFYGVFGVGNADNSVGLNFADSDITAIVSNCFFVGFNRTGMKAMSGSGASGATVYAYNNTFVDCMTAMEASSGGGWRAKNNLYFSNGISGADGYVGTFHADSTNNASNLASDAPGSNARNSQTYTFVNAGAGDYRLAAGDAGAKDFGADLSADAAFAFTIDHDGDTRSGSWDIGADEVAGAAASITDVSPATGSPAGGTAVTITGTGFTSGDGIRFGANDATSVVVVDATTITCVAPAGSAGAVDVHLRRGGSTIATDAGAYTYVAPALDSFEIIETGGGALADFFVGTPRTIRLRALDQYGAVLTSFTSTVTVAVTGSILSAGGGTSASFTSGVLDLSVTFSALGTGVELDVAGTSDPSKVGLSDPFDVVLPPSAGGATRRIGSGSPYFGF